MTTPKDPVEDFFAARPNFVCSKLNARILRLQCFKRMIAPKPGKGTYGSKKPDNFMDAYCRSGECPVGLETLKLLGMEQEYLDWKNGLTATKDTDDNVPEPSPKTRK